MSKLTPHNDALLMSLLNCFLYFRISGIWLSTRCCCCCCWWLGEVTCWAPGFTLIGRVGILKYFWIFFQPLFVAIFISITTTYNHNKTIKWVSDLFKPVLMKGLMWLWWRVMWWLLLLLLLRIVRVIWNGRILRHFILHTPQLADNSTHARGRVVNIVR